MRVSVIIPAFNAWRLTKACVLALQAATAADLLAEIIVADDGSTDGESAAWAQAQSGVTAVLCDRNRGFSHACNAGAAAAGGELLFFLNNDAFVRPGAVATLRAALGADPAIGIAGAKLLYADGSLQHAGLALLDGPVSRWWHVHRQLSGTLPDAEVARDLLAVTGAALMIRRSLFTALGGFDAGFRNGWEDVDLCLKAWRCGARVRYEPAAVIEHLESATLGRSHDDAANETRFVERWSTALAEAPRYALAEVPPVALAVTPGESVDPWARDHLRIAWGAHFGAKVRLVRAGSRVDRARFEVSAALAKRRPTLEVSLAGAASARPTGGLRAALVAPRSTAEAERDAGARDVTAWWTPTAASRGVLVEAGVAAENVSVVAFGALLPGPGTTPSARTGAPVVAARPADAGVLDALRSRSPEIRAVVLREDGVPALSGIDVIVARRGGDRWGLLIPAALAAGCHVVATPPLDPHVATATGVQLVDDAYLLVTLRERIADMASLRAAAPEIALAAGRRLDATLATQRAAQLARALVHGSPSSATVEVGPALAAHLRAASEVPA